MSIKQISDALFGVDALVGWGSSGILLFISRLSIVDITSQFAAISGTLVAVGSGVFSMLKLREGWLKARAERRMAEVDADEKE